MKFYYEVIKLLFRKYVLRQKTGIVLKSFCEKMGVVYIKLAQILSTQNFGNLFDEEDRVILSSLCDDCSSVSFLDIKKIIESEFDKQILENFEYIDSTPIGKASISQVHKARLKSG